MEDILGSELVTEGATTKPLAEALAGVEFVGLYFGAHWAPCCRRFTNEFLSRWYATVNEDGKKFEVVFVSKDGNQAAFDRNFANMPWTAIQYDNEPRKKQLEQRYGIMEIPKLIILKAADGTLVSDDGESDFQDKGAAAILQEWRAKGQQEEAKEEAKEEESKQ